MTEINTKKPIVVRTERGLSINGTRTTIYDVMDYLVNNKSSDEIKHWLNLTDEEMTGVMEYIEMHREEVEKEYQEVLEYAEEVRHYWKERNKELFARVATMKRSPEKQALWDKVQALKAKLELERKSFREVIADKTLPDNS